MPDDNQQAAPAVTVQRSIAVSLPEHKITISEDGNPVKEITDFSTGRRAI